jgi:hypothetical protein
MPHTFFSLELRSKRRLFTNLTMLWNIGYTAHGRIAEQMLSYLSLETFKELLPAVGIVF